MLGQDVYNYPYPKLVTRFVLPPPAQKSFEPVCNKCVQIAQKTKKQKQMSLDFKENVTFFYSLPMHQEGPWSLCFYVYPCLLLGQRKANQEGVSVANGEDLSRKVSGIKHVDTCFGVSMFVCTFKDQQTQNVLNKKITPLGCIAGGLGCSLYTCERTEEQPFWWRVASCFLFF